MDAKQQEALDQAIQELRRAFHWRAELIALIGAIIQNSTSRSWHVDLRTHQVQAVNLPYAQEAEQLDQANELIARLMRQIDTVSMTPTVEAWSQQRNEVVSAEQMVAFAHLDALKAVMLDVPALLFDEP